MQKHHILPLKLTKKTLSRGQGHPSGAFIVDYKQISDISLVFQLLTFNKWMPVDQVLQTCAGAQLSNWCDPPLPSSLNPFQDYISFLCPLKASDISKVVYIFMEYIKEIFALNGSIRLKKIISTVIYPYCYCWFLWFISITSCWCSVSSRWRVAWTNHE